jgi:molybdopterin-guanine dinucleotide biosynthesis protein A
MGLYSGLRASRSERTFVTTADSPLLRRELVRYLQGNAGGWDALVPLWRGYPEPLCAVYARSCIEAIAESLEMGRVVSFYPRVRVRFVEEPIVRGLDPRGRSFLNANTPEDLQVIRREWEEGCASDPADC